MFAEPRHTGCHAALVIVRETNKPLHPRTSCCCCNPIIHPALAGAGWFLLHDAFLALKRHIPTLQSAMVQGWTDLGGSVRVVSSGGLLQHRRHSPYRGWRAHMLAACTCAHTGPHGAFDQASAAHPFPLQRGCDKCYVRRARQHAHPVLVCLHQTHTPTTVEQKELDTGLTCRRETVCVDTHSLSRQQCHISNNTAALLCVYEGCFCRWVRSHTPGLPAPHTLGCKYSNTHACIHTLMQASQRSSQPTVTPGTRCVPFFAK